MAAGMTHWERVRAAIKGQDVDRLPVSGDQFGEAAAEGRAPVGLGPGVFHQGAEPAHSLDPLEERAVDQVGVQAVIRSAVSRLAHPFRESPALEGPGVGADARFAHPEDPGDGVDREGSLLEQEQPEDSPADAGETLGLEENAGSFDEVALGLAHARAPLGTVASLTRDYMFKQD